MKLSFCDLSLEGQAELLRLVTENQDELFQFVIKESNWIVNICHRRINLSMNGLSQKNEAELLQFVTKNVKLNQRSVTKELS